MFSNSLDIIVLVAMTGGINGSEVVSSVSLGV